MSEPHDGVPAGRPTPRKLIAASARMAIGRKIVPSTTISAATFGRTCRTMILKSLAPIARAASMYTFSFSDSTAPRITRAAPTAIAKPMASDMMTMSRKLGIPNHVPDGSGVLSFRNTRTAESSLPMTAMIASSRTIAGKASSESTSRWSTESMKPPK